MSEFVYPQYLLGTPSNFVKFTANKYQYGGKGPELGSICFYHPANIAFADGASYSTFDLGPLGREMAGVVNNNGNISDAMSKAANTTFKDSPEASELRTYLGIKILKDAAGGIVPGAEAAPAVYGTVKGIAVNPNTTSTFSNMNIRTYVFNFKMVAESQKDSALIRDIQNFIRDNIYAEEGPGGYMLNYPSTFNISFHTSNGLDNPYYPKVYECFMTNFQTNFNASSHLHHDGGAPVEVDVSMTFQETKVLTKGDINVLNGFVGGSTQEGTSGVDGE